MSDSNIVTVFGANDPAAGSEAYETAREVGATLARLGYCVANGGYGGTMEASARGASEAGGKTIGVVCSIWNSRPNRYVKEVVATGSLAERIGKLVELGTAGYVVLPGATGTLVELASVWELMLKKQLAVRPIVCMGGFWRPLVEMMSAARPGCEKLVAVAESPDEIAKYFPRRDKM